MDVVYRKTEKYFSDPKTFGVSMSDVKDPEKIRQGSALKNVESINHKFGFRSAADHQMVPVDNQSEFEKPDNSKIIPPILGVADKYKNNPVQFGFRSSGFSPSGCNYQNKPIIKNGEFTCDDDFCTLRCEAKFAWTNSGRMHKKIKCDIFTKQWVAVDEKLGIPSCSNVCPRPNYSSFMPQYLDEYDNTFKDFEIKDYPRLLTCNRMGGEKCSPDQPDCRHADQCYITCPEGMIFDVSPNKNTITCDCTGARCKWIDQGGQANLRAMSRCVPLNSAAGQAAHKSKMRQNSEKSLHGFTSDSMQRIIGGSQATRGDDSSLMISFGYFGLPPDATPKLSKRTWQHICGGVLLNTKWGWTAAHCKKAKLRAIIGEYELNKKDGSEVPCKVLMQIRHPLYDGGTHNDIMMTHLKCKKLVLGDMITPALLPSPNTEAPEGLNCRVCGWGNTAYPDYKPADTLQCVNLPIIPSQECNKNYANSIHDDIFCIGEIGVSGKDSCQGDSGGPALCGGIVYGLVMGGLYCAHPDYPGVYTKVSHYIYWAKNVIDATQSRKSLYKRSKRSLYPPKEIRNIERDRFLIEG